MSHHPNHLNETKTQQTLLSSCARTDYLSPAGPSWRELKAISGSPDRRAAQTRRDSRREPQGRSRFGQNLEPSPGLRLGRRLQRGLWGPGADEWGTQEAKRLQTLWGGVKRPRHCRDCHPPVPSRELEDAARPRRGATDVPSTPAEGASRGASQSSLGSPRAHLRHPCPVAEGQTAISRSRGLPSGKLRLPRF